MSDLSLHTEELIERYLSGQMSAAEREGFEQILSSRPELEQEVNKHLIAKGAAFKEGRDSWRAAKRERFRRWEEEDRRGRLRWGKLAAVILILFLSAGAAYVFHPAPQVGPDKLFLSFYEVDTAPVPRNQLSGSKLLEGYLAFNQGEFVEALSIWKEVPASLDQFTRDELAYFKGLSYLELGQSTKAILALESLDTSAYQAKAHWYLALIWLKEGYPDKARVYLSSNAIQASFLHPKAQLLLEHLSE
ncbi:MAG: hypothetical protein AAF587_20060 [Bacteroidota bacterium]